MIGKNRAERLRDQNEAIRQRIQQFKHQRANSGNLQNEIVRFVDESKKNLSEMNEKIAEENAKQNQKLHQMTGTYEVLLKKQIEVLTENKKLTERKDAQDKIFNENIEALTGQYETQIKQFEEKVKQNVKKIQDLSGSNIINRLLKNKRFRETMATRGCSLDSLEKQSQLEEVSIAVQEKEKQIGQAEEKSAQLDEELAKMHELIDTMKQLMDNMMKEKENIVKQNAILKEKLQQSQELIGRLLGGKQGGDAGDAEDQDGQQQQGEQEDAQN